MKPLGIDQIEDIMAGRPVREPAGWRVIIDTNRHRLRITQASGKASYSKCR